MHAPLPQVGPCVQCAHSFLSFFLSFFPPRFFHPFPPTWSPLSPFLRCPASVVSLLVGCWLWLAVLVPSLLPSSRLCVCVKHLNRRKTSSNTCFHCGGGNLMFAADCPTKRAAFMTDINLGRWSRVPSISTSFSCRFPFTVNGNRPSQEPASRSLFHARLPQTSI